MSKILIVEDELNMLRGLKDNLEFEGYETDSAKDGNTGLSKILNNNYDLVVLDVMLPNISGFDICKKVRSENIDTPIILLTAKGEEIDKILGLELGADDYITKPFSVRELLARIKAILRRSVKQIPENGNPVQIGKLNLNFKNYEATANGYPIRLTHKKFEVLKDLYTNKLKVIHRNELMREVWDIGQDITTRTVDNFILRLRQKIEVDPNNPKIIRTVRGVGYKMIL
ncbi:MAG: response regulator transcription factor [Cytophagales bacterium]|nr:response regulator transcription factor [Cytophagales bacterium]